VVEACHCPRDPRLPESAVFALGAYHLHKHAHPTRPSGVLAAALGLSHSQTHSLILAGWVLHSGWRDRERNTPDHPAEVSPRERISQALHTAERYAYLSRMALLDSAATPA